MLQVLDDFVSKHPIDVALCTLDEAAFGAALQGRRKLFADFKRGAPACALDADAYRNEVKKLQVNCAARRLPSANPLKIPRVQQLDTYLARQELSGVIYRCNCSNERIAELRTHAFCK
eukprot:6174012-Pleurochrysis_carterae.AAC.2